MKLHIIILNIQGLNDTQAQFKVHNYFLHLFCSMDFICQLEHKPREEKLSLLRLSIWKESKFIERDPSIANNHALSDPRAKSGRQCMLISPKISHLIYSTRFCGNNRAQWVPFSGFPGGNVVDLNLYDTTSTSKGSFSKTNYLLSYLLTVNG